jgi:cell wall-associated NlpC family hydrolase
MFSENWSITKNIRLSFMKSPASFRNGFLFMVPVVILMLLSACGVASRSTLPDTSVRPAASTQPRIQALSGIQQELYRAHEEWRGTPYVLGGSSKRGVDCSSFIQIIFDRHFGVSLPRHTGDQIREGAGVRRSSVRPGDLIFFRTSRRSLHVGIALNNEEFLHASTSSGVMISSLDERYWASRFLGVRRVM